MLAASLALPAPPPPRATRRPACATRFPIRPETVRRPKRVSAAELMTALNDALAARPECDGIRIGGRCWDIEEGATGCNWSETSLIVRVHGNAGHGAFAALREIIADARAQYDLRPVDAA